MCVRWILCIQIQKYSAAIHALSCGRHWTRMELSTILLKYRCKLAWQMWSRRGPVAQLVSQAYLYLYLYLYLQQAAA